MNNEDKGIKFFFIFFSLIVALCLLSMKADAEDPLEGVSPYRLICLTPSDEQLLAQCLEAECGSAEYCGQGNIEEGMRCKRATCQVILNRMLNERFKAKGDIQRIICSPSQFTTYPGFLGAKPSEETYRVMYETLMGENLVIDYETCFFSLAQVPNTEYVATIGAHVFSK